MMLLHVLFAFDLHADTHPLVPNAKLPLDRGTLAMPSAMVDSSVALGGVSPLHVRSRMKRPAMLDLLSVCQLWMEQRDIVVEQPL